MDFCYIFIQFLEALIYHLKVNSKKKKSGINIISYFRSIKEKNIYKRFLLVDLIREDLYGA